MHRISVLMLFLLVAGTAFAGHKADLIEKGGAQHIHGAKPFTYQEKYVAASRFLLGLMYDPNHANPNKTDEAKQTESSARGLIQDFGLGSEESQFLYDVAQEYGDHLALLECQLYGENTRQVSEIKSDGSKINLISETRCSGYSQPSDPKEGWKTFRHSRYELFKSTINRITAPSFHAFVRDRLIPEDGNSQPGNVTLDESDRLDGEVN